MRIGKMVAFLSMGAAVAVVGVITQQPVTEAPAGFTTPTLGENPGSQSIAMALRNRPATLSPSIRHSLNEGMT
jgi:hypothetical protein